MASSILSMDDPSPSGPLPLTGPKSYSFEEALRVLADVTGTDAGRFESISVLEWKSDATRMGIPESFVQSLTNLFVAISKGRDDVHFQRCARGAREGATYTLRHFSRSLERDDLTIGDHRIVRME